MNSQYQMVRSFSESIKDKGPRIPYSLYFDNHHYNIDEEEEDDDPFYEIDECSKVTFIENKLNDPLDKYEICKFAKEDLEDWIKAQVKDKPKKKEI